MLPSLLIPVSVFIPNSAAAQDATVTVYAHGSNLTNGLPGSNHGIFYGWIFDGNVRLNSFRNNKFFAQIHNNRFVVYHLPPGPHVFSATYGKKPSKRSQLPINLVAGKSYYFRAQSESRGVIDIEWEYGRLDQVTCQEAQTETAKAKRMTGDVFSPEGKAALSSVQAVPACQ